MLIIDARDLVREDNEEIYHPISAIITIINLPHDSHLLPGGISKFKTQSTAATSYTAVSVELVDDSGARVSLAINKKAMITIPLTTTGGNQPPATKLPLSYFDQSTGLWLEQGYAALAKNELGEYSYQGEVSHFTTWNFKQVTQ